MINDPEEMRKMVDERMQKAKENKEKKERRRGQRTPEIELEEHSPNQGVSGAGVEENKGLDGEGVELSE